MSAPLVPGARPIAKLVSRVCVSGRANVGMVRDGVPSRTNVARSWSVPSGMLMTVTTTSFRAQPPPSSGNSTVRDGRALSWEAHEDLAQPRAGGPEASTPAVVPAAAPPATTTPTAVHSHQRR